MAVPDSPEKAIFLQAIEKDSLAERAAFLDEACQGNPQLRAEVEALLRAHNAPQPALDTRDPGSPTTDDLVSERPGTAIGPYKLLQQIGEGGMGAVFMAEQTQPVQRMVALKIIKPGMDSRQVLARFEAERQALALMDHPNIAKVLDVGKTAAGRPYFVMELVKGVPITKYCDEHQLPPRQRLELFLPVCHAVQHAHQKGIIHRDLKPSNVLLASYDDVPVPKVIDFGVAKATGQRLTEKTMFTELGQLVGTLEYMSPEQAKLNSLDIDTRSDIYALGVLLYELLTGTTPFEKKRLRAAALDEILRIIREEEPPKPSTRLSTIEELPSIAARRGLEPKRLSGLVRGELDWIVMKALSKERNRRYETANGLVMELQRFLAGEPVLAAPPSARYRLGKLARKYRAVLATAAGIALLLVAGISVSTWQAVRAMKAEAQALVAQQAEARRAESEALAKHEALAAAEGERKAREVAQKREAETRAVLEFVENKVFAAARPQGQEGGLGRDVTLHRAIEQALPFVEQTFHEQPLVEARLRSTLGTSFWYLGEPRIAADQFQAARAIYAAHLGPDHPDTLASMMGLGNSYSDLGRYAEALKLNEETLALQKAKQGPDHPNTLNSALRLANSYHRLGRHAEALKLYEETLTLQEAKLGPDHPDTLRSRTNLANSYATIGRLDAALKLQQETLALQKAKLGPDRLDTLRSMHSLANIYDRLGRQAEALRLREETLALQKAQVGPNHPDTLRSMMNLANSYATFGRLDDALKLQQETLALQNAKLGPDHPDTLGSMYNIACLHAMMISKAADRNKQADLAMESLNRAVAAGFKDVALIKQDTDLDALRGRDDFKKLVAQLEAKVTKEKK
jgi:serine/threonine protein kinase/tetratricopeptide (TPR) repeat protein